MISSNKQWHVNGEGVSGKCEATVQICPVMPNTTDHFASSEQAVAHWAESRGLNQLPPNSKQTLVLSDIDGTLVKSF